MSGISGYGSIGRADDFPVEESAAAATGETPAEPEQEGQIVRGGAPATAVVTEALHGMTATELQSKLMAADDGLTKTEAKAQAKEIKATAEEVDQLQKDLADLKDVEKMYEDMLADPDLDEWDAWWIESDLWDVRMDMYDIQDQLGELTGDLKDLMGGAWGNLLGALDTGLGMIRLEGQRQQNLDGQFDAQRANDRRTREDIARAQRDAERRMETLREKGLVIPIPPKSEVGKKIAADLSKKLEAAKQGFSEERLAGLRDVKKALLDASAKASSLRR